MNLYMLYVAKLQAGWFSYRLGPIMELSWKIRNLSLCSITFEHCHSVQNFTLVDEMLLKIQSDPSPLGHFFQKRFGEFLKNDPHIFQGAFFYIVKHTYLLKYLTHRPSVCQSFSPSVIGICDPFLVRPQVLGLLPSMLPKLQTVKSLKGLLWKFVQKVLSLGNVVFQTKTN